MYDNPVGMRSAPTDAPPIQIRLELSGQRGDWDGRARVADPDGHAYTPLAGRCTQRAITQARPSGVPAHYRRPHRHCTGHSSSAGASSARQQPRFGCGAAIYIRQQHPRGGGGDATEVARVPGGGLSLDPDGTRAPLRLRIPPDLHRDIDRAVARTRIMTLAGPSRLSSSKPGPRRRRGNPGICTAHQ